MQLLDEFPDAREYYENRAIDRRIELRRVNLTIPLISYIENEKTWKIHATRNANGPEEIEGEIESTAFSDASDWLRKIVHWKPRGQYAAKDGSGGKHG